MMKKNLFLIFLFLGTVASSHSQNLNAYKYVVVPDKFEFLKEENQYQLNVLTKFLFEKYGFETFVQGETIPEELNVNRCDALHANVENNSGLFRTKLKLILKDCNNKIIFQSDEGVSNEKDFKTAYHEALRNAFKSIEALNYERGETIVTARPIPQNIPTENKVIDQSLENKTEVSVNTQQEKVVENSNPQNGVVNKKFIKDKAEFYLKPTSNGFSIYQSGMAEPFAALIKSSTGNNFIYSSISSKGMAHFNESGDLVVEILNSETNTLESIIYKVQL